MSSAMARSSPNWRAMNSRRSASSRHPSWRSPNHDRDRGAPGAGRRKTGSAPGAARRAAGAVACPRHRRDRLAQPARHQLFRLHADAEPRHSDRACDDGADVRHRRQRPRPLDRPVRRVRVLRLGDLASRRASAWRAHPCGLRCGLCGARRAHLLAQPALDRRHARHEFRLAGAGDPAAPETGRQGARLAAGGDGREAADRAVPDPCRCAHRGGRLVRPHAHLLRRDPARLGRQRARAAPRRLVAFEGQGEPLCARGPVRRAFGHGACRHHHLGRRQYRQWLYASLHRRRDPGRRRVHRRKSVADRRRRRRAHDGDGGLAASDLHAHPAGLAGGGQRRDPHHRARRARPHQPRRGRSLTAASSLAVFMVIVGVGQMFVITLGPGNVDLSLPANVGLASAVAMKTMAGDDRLVALGLAAALASGLAVGVANYLLIWALRIPPIIATLSASFIIQSVDISYGRGLQIKPPPGFAEFTNVQFAGVPLLAILAALFAFGAHVALHRTVWGRSVTAIGQNIRAARLAGIKVEPVRFATYALCGVFGGLNGALLAGYFRGANVDIGNEYLLASIAVVVIGGTSVAGGKANLPGVWGGALFLVLLLTMLNTFGVSAGVRLLATGLIIVAVITAAGGEKETR